MYRLFYLNQVVLLLEIFEIFQTFFHIHIYRFGIYIFAVLNVNLLHTSYLHLAL